MTLDLFTLIALLIILFALIFSSVYYVPVFIAKIIAAKNGLKLNLKQAKIVSKNHCLKKDFLIRVKEIWNLHPIPIEKLTMHYLAGGDLGNIKHGIYEFKVRNKEPDIWFLMTFDLAKRNLTKEIEKAEKNDWKFEL